MPARTTGSRSLKDYHRKRRFDSTPEPRGDAKADARRRRKARKLFFCVQKHLASHLHYDFRLEHKGVLLSWAVPKGPSLNPADKRLAMRVEDHPWDYRQFEGVIPDGYGAGIVVLWDRGTWKPAQGFEDVDRALERGELKFLLTGVKLKGSWVLVRTRGGPYARAGGEGRSWLLIKHRDEWAGDVDITTFAPRSVKSDRDFAEVLAADKPKLWESDRPARGGATGKLLQQIIDEAALIKARRGRAPNRKRRSFRP
jgi:bifunctional non-homologous end joining protein LigD